MISREEQQQAMKELKHMISELKADTATFNHPLSRQLVHTLSVAVDCLEIALSQPERPKGRWIKELPYISIGGAYMKGVECSVCHSYFTSDGNTPYKLHPYCCECGADMRGEEE